MPPKLKTELWLQDMWDKDDFGNYMNLDPRNPEDFKTVLKHNEWKDKWSKTHNDNDEAAVTHATFGDLMHLAATTKSKDNMNGSMTEGMHCTTSTAYTMTQSCIDVSTAYNILGSLTGSAFVQGGLIDGKTR